MKVEAAIAAAWSLQQEIGKIGRNHTKWENAAKRHWKWMRKAKRFLSDDK